MVDKSRWMGPGDQTYDYFTEITNTGYDDLERAREDIYKAQGDGITREPKRWPATQAAALIGRSGSWLRDADPENASKNASGHAVWSLDRLLAIADQIGTRYVRPANTAAFVIALAKFKGGVGSSSNCSHIAHGLAMRGLKVLVIDFDPQGSSTQVVGGYVPDTQVTEEDLPNEALIRDPALVMRPDSQVVKSTYFHGVDLICGNSYLNKLDQHLTMTTHTNKPDGTSLHPVERLNTMLSHIKDQYDVVLIDCPPTLGSLTSNALYAADGIITSLRPELFDRASLVSFTESLAAFTEQTNKEYRYMRILLSQSTDGLPTPGPGNSRATTNAQKAEDVRQGHRRNEFYIRDLYGDAVMNNMMSFSTAISKSVGEFSTVFAHPRHLGSKQSWDRGVDIATRVVDEVFEDLKVLWEDEAEQNA